MSTQNSSLPSYFTNVNTLYSPAHHKKNDTWPPGCSPKHLAPGSTAPIPQKARMGAKASHSHFPAVPHLARTTFPEKSGAAELRAVCQLLPVFHCIFLSLFVPETMYCGQRGSAVTLFTFPAGRASALGRSPSCWEARPVVFAQHCCMPHALRNIFVLGAELVSAPSYSSFRERKAGWLQLSGWMRGLQWYRWRLPRCAGGAGKGRRAGLHIARIPGRGVWQQSADSGSQPWMLGSE